MKMINPEKQLAYWQHMERDDFKLAEAVRKHREAIYRAAKKEQLRTDAQDVLGAFIFCGFVVGLTLIIWGFMQ